MFNSGLSNKKFLNFSNQMCICVLTQSTNKKRVCGKKTTSDSAYCQECNDLISKRFKNPLENMDLLFENFKKS